MLALTVSPPHTFQPAAAAVSRSPVSWETWPATGMTDACLAETPRREHQYARGAAWLALWCERGETCLIRHGMFEHGKLISLLINIYGSLGREPAA